MRGLIQHIKSVIRELIRLISWIWTDDKTGKHSDTTLWQNLAGFPLYFMIWTAVGIFYKYSEIYDAQTWWDAAAPFFYFLAGILGLNVVAYSVKRFRETFSGGREGKDDE